MILSLLLMGCAHWQSNSDLLDTFREKNMYASQRFDLSQFNVALLVKSGADTFNPVSKRITAPVPAVASYVTTNNEIIEQLRKDLKTFFITARHLRMSDMPADLEIFSEVADEYLETRIDPLLKDNMNVHTPEMRNALTELQYYKAHLQYEIEDLEGACKTLAEMESRIDDKMIENPQILSERFNKVSGSYFVLSDFSFKCK